LGHKKLKLFSKIIFNLLYLIFVKIEKSHKN
jgi:hypothetical protein